MSTTTVATHHGGYAEPHGHHPGSLSKHLQLESSMNTTCPVCGDEIVDIQSAVLHGDADYPFEPTYLTHAECDSVSIGEGL